MVQRSDWKRIRHIKFLNKETVSAPSGIKNRGGAGSFFSFDGPAFVHNFIGPPEGEPAFEVILSPPTASLFTLWVEGDYGLHLSGSSPEQVIYWEDQSGFRRGGALSASLTASLYKSNTTNYAIHTGSPVNGINGVRCMASISGTNATYLYPRGAAPHSVNQLFPSAGRSWHLFGVAQPEVINTNTTNPLNNQRLITGGSDRFGIYISTSGACAGIISLNTVSYTTALTGNNGWHFTPRIPLSVDTPFVYHMQYISGAVGTNSGTLSLTINGETVSAGANDYFANSAGDFIVGALSHAAIRWFSGSVYAILATSTSLDQATINQTIQYLKTKYAISYEETDPDLVFWFKAEDAEVNGSGELTQWVDSVNGYTLLPYTGTFGKETRAEFNNQTVVYSPALRANMSSSVPHEIQLPNPTGDFTFIWVGAWRDSQSGCFLTMLRNDSSTGTSQDVMKLASLDNKLVFGSDQDASGGGGSPIIAGLESRPIAVIGCFEKSGSNHLEYLYLSATGSTVISVSSSLKSSGTLSVHWPVSRNMTSSVAEMRLYNRLFSESDRLDFWAYCQNKYNITMFTGSTP